MMNLFLKNKYLLIIISIFLISNISSFSLNFGMRDDYPFLNLVHTNINFIQSQNNINGRPLNGLLLQAVFNRLQYISEFRYIRMISFIGVIFLLIILDKIFSQYDLNQIEKIYLLISLVTLPSINLYINWAVCSMVPFALLLAAISSICVFNIYDIVKSRFILKIICSIFCLTASILIYQPASMYYFVISYIYLYFPIINGKKEKKHFSAMIIIFLIALLIAWLMMLLIGANKSPRAALINFEKLPLKLVWFARDVIPYSLNFNLLINNKIIPAVLLLLIVIGFLFMEKSITKILINIVVYFLLIILSYFPNLIVSENWASYRTQVAISSLFLLMGFLGIRNIVTYFNKQNYKTGGLIKKIYLFGLLLLIVLNVSWYTYNQIVYITFPQSVEIAYIKNLLATKVNKKTTNTIYFIRPTNEDAITRCVFDEFGCLSSEPQWSPANIIKLLLRELNYKKDVKIIILPPKSQTPQLNEDEIAINLSKIKTFRLINNHYYHYPK